MVNISLILALVFLGITLFLTIKRREWWLAGFAVVTGLLFAGNKFGVWVTSNLNEFATWIVSLFH
jgi:hypothetical protein